MVSAINSYAAAYPYAPALTPAGLETGSSSAPADDTVLNSPSGVTQTGISPSVSNSGSPQLSPDMLYFLQILFSGQANPNSALLGNIANTGIFGDPVANAAAGAQLEATYGTPAATLYSDISYAQAYAGLYGAPFPAKSPMGLMPGLVSLGW